MENELRNHSRGLSLKANPRYAGGALLRWKVERGYSWIADALNISKRTGLRLVKELSAVGLRFEGPTKKGCWVFDKKRQTMKGKGE